MTMDSEIEWRFYDIESGHESIRLSSRYGRDSPDCIVLGVKTGVAGGVIGTVSTIISLAGFISENKLLLLAGYTGLIFGLGVMFALDIGRKLGGWLIRRE